MSKRIITLHVNGKDREVAIDERESLYDTLRNELRLTSIKKGCEVGECGACSVLLNGRCVDTCIYLTVWAEGKDIVTVEGLKDEKGELSDVQKEFVKQAKQRHKKSDSSLLSLLMPMVVLSVSGRASPFSFH